MFIYSTESVIPIITLKALSFIGYATVTLLIDDLGLGLLLCSHQAKARPYWKDLSAMVVTWSGGIQMRKVSYCVDSMWTCRDLHSTVQYCGTQRGGNAPLGTQFNSWTVSKKVSRFERKVAFAIFSHTITCTNISLKDLLSGWVFSHCGFEKAFDIYFRINMFCTSKLASKSIISASFFVLVNLCIVGDYIYRTSGWRWKSNGSNPTILLDSYELASAFRCS